MALADPDVKDLQNRTNLEALDRRLIQLGKLVRSGGVGGKTAIYDQYFGKPDGPLGTTDSGKIDTASNNGVTGAALTIVGEALTNTATSGAPAGYIDCDLGAPVRSLGVEFTFGPGSTYNGVVALLVWKSSVSTAGGVAPDSPCHFYITPEGWGYQYVNASGTFTAIRVGQFATRLETDGTTVHRVEIFMEDETAVVTLPSGEIAEFSDPHIASLAANFAGWEILQSDASTDTRPAIISRWADTREVQAYDSRSRGAHTLRQIESAVKTATPTLNMPTSVAATVTTPTYPTQSDIHSSLTTVFTPPATGAFAVEVEGYVVQSADDRLVWAIYANSISHSDSSIQTVVERRVDGLVRATFAFEGFPPGEAVQVNWQHTCVSGASSFKIDTSVYGYRPKVKIVPLSQLV